MPKFESLKNKALPLVLVAAVVGGYATVNMDESNSDRATISTELKSTTDPYEDETVLVYAPRPLTVEQAVEHYVGMDQPRTDLTDAGQDRVIAELTDQYEAQTGAPADQPFPGNPNGSQWISIDLSE